jgi:hypothetical protein
MSVFCEAAEQIKHKQKIKIMNSKKKKLPELPTIKNFIGTAKFDENNGGYIWGVDDKGGYQMIAEVRGWGAIQHLFKTQSEAADFQDKMGMFIAEAINDKLKLITKS